MTDPLSLYAGRKFLGPLDKAVISSHRTKMKFARTVLLQEYIEELQELEEQLEDKDLSSLEKLMLETALKIKEAQFHDFLGVPYDGKDEINKLFEEKI